MMTRKEKMLSALIKGETPDIEPITRTEKYLECAIKKSGTADAPEPVTRMDYLLRELADKMSQGGSGAETQTKTVALSMADGDQTVTPDSGKVLSSVTITKPDTLIPGNIKKDVNIGGVVGTLESGGGTQPQLHAPTISISEDTLTITPAANNGDFVTGWKGYSTVGGEEEFSLFGTLPAAVTSLDLTTMNLPASTYRFKATASGTNFQDSADSNVVNYSNIFYNVTNTLTNCTSSNSAASVRHGSAYSATLTASSGYTMSGATVTVTMGGTDITSTAYSNGVVTIAALTGALVVTASAAELNQYDFATASWASIKSQVLAGQTAEIYGNQVGTTRSITLKNGDTYTLRLANATNDMYTRSDGSGFTGFVVEFVELWNTKYQMNETGTNIGGWEDSYMRNTVMPLILAQLPDDLAAVLATVNIEGCESGSDGTLNTTQDKLFIPAEREIYSSRSKSRQEEFSALQQWNYYTNHTTGTDKVKKCGSYNTAWWLRSPYSGNTAWFLVIGTTGATDGVAANNVNFGASIAFCI